MPARAATSLATVLLGLALAGPAVAATARAERIVQAINRVRVQHHLSPLRSDARLVRAARRHSLAMARRHVLEHTVPLVLPVAPTAAVGENLAFVPDDGEGDVVAAWLASPPHRANLLSPRFRSIGVAEVGSLVTADFAG